MKTGTLVELRAMILKTGTLMEVMGGVNRVCSYIKSTFMWKKDFQGPRNICVLEQAVALEKRRSLPGFWVKEGSGTF